MTPIISFTTFRHIHSRPNYIPRTFDSHARVGAHTPPPLLSHSHPCPHSCTFEWGGERCVCVCVSRWGYGRGVNSEEVLGTNVEMLCELQSTQMYSIDDLFHWKGRGEQLTLIYTFMCIHVYVHASYITYIYINIKVLGFGLMSELGFRPGLNSTRPMSSLIAVLWPSAIAEGPPISAAFGALNECCE